MIRMIQSTSAEHAKAYFSDALQKSDYYINDQELQGQFHGRLATRIGLEKTATKESFFALCENVNPVTGEPLTPRTKEDRTTGYDINFHCPKSVSIVHALSSDEHILKAFQGSVNETMLDIEADAKTRVRLRKTYEDRETAELLWAEFTHQTARPVDDHAPDPHLHSHCFVFNATFDKQENRIKAGQFRDINRDMPYYQARFHKRLADKLTDLGYNIRRTDKSFEIEGVPQSVIDLFSKRTDEIGQVAKEKGITDAKALSELGAKTRAKKQKGLGMSDLKAEWKKQIGENITYKSGEENASVRYAPNRSVNIEPDKTNADDCIDYALHHSFERASVMAGRRILATAYRHGLGKRQVSIDSITDSFKNDSRIIHVKDKSQTVCTTVTALAEEKRMVDLARKGQGKFRPLYANTPDLNPKLNDQQALAIGHVLTTPHQVSIIRGAAGTGKTTVMTEARKHIANAGKELFVVAPTSEASRGVLVAEGFENATTVAQLLQDKKLQEQLKDQVVWGDEAGLLGTKDMASLLALADRQNCRLILGGDTRQHSSVVRGDALRILNTVGGIKTAEVSKIHRQKNVHYRAAVEDLSRGDVSAAFIKLNSIGAIKNVDPLKPNEILIGDYMKAAKKGKSVLIVSPTHQQGNAVTDEVRKKLRASGMIGKKEVRAKKFENLNLTEAQKTDWRNFKPGQIVQFNQNVPQIKRGSIWSVNEVNKNGIAIINDAGKTTQLPQSKSSAYEVYQQSEIGLSKGDKVRITRNSFDNQNKRLNNGQSLEVEKVNKSGSITLINRSSKARFELDQEFGHIAHAYCTTSHSAQGKTVDEVFISQPSSTFTATDAKQFYVSVSRGRDTATIYTDDRRALLEYASELGDRQSALELVGKKNKHLDYVQQVERDKYNFDNVSVPMKNEPIKPAHYRQRL
ncbi:MAG TPA: MobF family relaxase [Mucilaginibacter sp.]|nr:MobF family relaxase [Mucilaginibacter sp.]